MGWTGSAGGEGLIPDYEGTGVQRLQARAPPS